MTDTEFQSKILKGVETLEARQTARFDEFDRKTKSLVEDVTRLKKHANDTAAGRAEFERSILRADGAMQREQRGSFVSPLQRIVENDELRTRLNLAVRQAVNSDGRFSNQIGTLTKALGETSSPGSTVIDDKLAAEIYNTLATYGVWKSFAVRPVSTRQTKFPVKTARAVANYVLTEAGTIADDTTKAGTSVTGQVEIIAALVNVSLQLIEDAEADITADVLDDFAEAYALRLDHSCLNAAGAANGTDGSMTGVFQGGTAAVADTGDITTELLDLNDFIRCLITVDPAVLTRPSRWWMNPQILVRCVNIVDANGRPIFQTALEAPSPGGIGSILGYPVTLAHAAPSTNTVNSKVAVFGDPNGLVVGMRKDFAFEASDQARWSTLERSFRGWGRAGTRIRRSTAFAVLTLAAS